MSAPPGSGRVVSVESVRAMASSHAPRAGQQCPRLVAAAARGSRPSWKSVTTAMADAVQQRLSPEERAALGAVGHQLPANALQLAFPAPCPAATPALHREHRAFERALCILCGSLVACVVWSSSAGLCSRDRASERMPTCGLRQHLLRRMSRTECTVRASLLFSGRQQQPRREGQARCTSSCSAVASVV